MDYPFPLISVDARGALDLRQAYAPFAGGWDSLTVRYAYTGIPMRAPSGRASTDREGHARP